MNTSRRSFFKCLVGAFVASAIELNMTTEQKEMTLDGLAPTARISNAVLDRIYSHLLASAT